MAPSVMLSAVTKTLVRKLGAEAFTSQDNLEDSMRKVDDDDHVGFFYFFYFESFNLLVNFLPTF